LPISAGYATIGEATPGSPLYPYLYTLQGRGLPPPQTVKKAGLLRKRLLLEEKLAKIGFSEPIFD